MTNIKNAYGVARNWQGDPCAPVKYMWEGLNCSIDGGNNPPRITYLNLSSIGLTGEISSSISKLTMLQYLDLSNNSLNDPLPDFLMQLRSLKILNVGKNKLTGLIPSGLLERSKTGSLSLSVEDNPGLCMTESCKKKNIVVPLVASFSALFVILLISFGFWIFRRQKGFISLDCGLPKDVNYSSLDTGINYISDAKFVDAGVSKKIAETDIKQELQYVRCFPSVVRNCYKINVTTGTKYLIRASFYYGNYDGLNDPPEFDIHFGANVWDTVKFINLSHITDREIIYTPSQDYIQPCLVNTGNGTPFISVIELRTLNNEVYVTNSAKSVLSPLSRSDVGSIANEYRYKNDVYDRIWFPSNSSFKRLHISPGTASLLRGNNYELPAIVMNTAVTPVTPSAPLNFSWEADNVNEQYYLYMHFKEVEKLSANETRSFNITVNDKFWYGNVTPKSLYTTAFSTKPLTGATRYQVSLFKTENSTLPPILNAYEVYKVKDFLQSETHQDDVDTMTNIKNAYGVTRNWEGDPCGPVNYMWEGLNCSVDGNSIPRITSLNLASSGLTGVIPSSISKLTMLQYLDLSNNSLNGPLPDFLMQLRSLKVLYVPC